MGVCDGQAQELVGLGTLLHVKADFADNLQTPAGSRRKD